VIGCLSRHQLPYLSVFTVDDIVLILGAYEMKSSMGNGRAALMTVPTELPPPR
jgi:hypothetical protein